jgi:hypothetical protein
VKITSRSHERGIAHAVKNTLLMFYDCSGGRNSSSAQKVISSKLIRLATLSFWRQNFLQ